MWFDQHFIPDGSVVSLVSPSSHLLYFPVLNLATIYIFILYIYLLYIIIYYRYLLLFICCIYLIYLYFILRLKQSINSDFSCNTILPSYTMPIQINYWILYFAIIDRDTDKGHVLRPYLIAWLVERFIAILRCTEQGPVKTYCDTVCFRVVSVSVDLWML